MSRPEVAKPDDAAIERVLRPLARKASGLTGADVEAVVQNARRKARREKRPVTYDDIESLLAGAKRERSLPLRWRIAVHEAGHAVVRLYFRLGPIVEITIDAPEGGYTLSAVSQDEHSEVLFTAFLVSYLAGRAAEEEFLGSATSASGGSEGSDLALATDLALDMETVMGFSGRWPLLYRKAKSGAAILAVDLELAERVNGRLTKAHTLAREIVHEQRTAIEFLAHALMEHETLEGPELDAVIEQARQKMVETPE